MVRLWSGLAVLSALAVAAGCSKTPHYYNDLTGGGGQGAGAGGGGGGPRCANPGDCGVTETECAHPTCIDGACGVTFTLLGTPLAAQLPGDCMKAVCDGSGGVSFVADPMDADDANPCTADACEGMTPKHVPVAAGTSCGQGPLLICNGMGTCFGCQNDAQCGAPGPCFTWSCQSAQCIAMPVTAGTATATGDTPGDCMRSVCDGIGAVSSISDPTDHPADPNPCMAGVCTSAGPTTQPKPAGTACPGGVCDGNGFCGQCVTDAECGAPTACAKPVCVANHCSATFTPMGTPTSAQAPGDCRTQVCDGAGGVTFAALDSDVPPNPDACNIATCAAGMVVITPIMIPPNPNPCATNTCDPATGMKTVTVPDGTACGGCSSCVSGTCSDPCPGMGCSCNGAACDCGGSGGGG